MAMRIFIILLVLLAAPTWVAHADPPTVGGCEMFPADNPWNTPIADAPVHPNSANYVRNINNNGGGTRMHPDFGEDPSYGIPWTTVTAAQPLVPISFYYDDDSDPGPYPIPSNAPVEGGGDRHVLVVETTNCMLYEVFDAQYTGSDATGWEAGSGAIFDLNSNDLRPEGWTSADAAGLPILPGLARCEEANSGTIDHALRFTVRRTQRAFVYPATHFASDITDPNYPPMGLRFRLKASYDISHLDGQALAIAQALKTYGMILADNGSNWFVSGETNPGCWDDDDLNRLKAIPGTAFEAIVSPPPPSEVAGDLLRNGGFEAGTPNGRRPTFWEFTSLRKDFRQCSRDISITGVGTIPVAHSGRCAFEFRGSASIDALRQNIRFDSGIPADSPLIFEGYAARNNLPTDAARVRFILFYQDGRKERRNVPIAAGSGGYAPIGLTLTPAEAVGLRRVRVNLIYTGGTGRLWLDSLSLRWGAPLIAMPPAPGQ